MKSLYSLVSFLEKFLGYASTMRRISCTIVLAIFNTSIIVYGQRLVGVSGFNQPRFFYLQLYEKFRVNMLVFLDLVW